TARRRGRPPGIGVPRPCASSTSLRCVPARRDGCRERPARAIPFGAIGELAPGAFAGKIVVDANNYYPNRDGHVGELDADDTTSTEMLASRLPDATLLQAVNTMYSGP